MNLINPTSLSALGYGSLGVLGGGLASSFLNMRYMQDNMSPTESSSLQNKANRFNTETQRYINSPDTRDQYQQQFNQAGKDFTDSQMQLQQKYQNPMSKYLPIAGGVLGATIPLAINKFR